MFFQPQATPRHFARIGGALRGGGRFFDVLDPSQLDPETEMAIRRYCCLRYAQINRHERGPLRYRPDDPKWMECTAESFFISHELSKHRVYADFFAYKSISTRRLQDMLCDFGRTEKVTTLDTSLVGRTMTERGFCSTSLVAKCVKDHEYHLYDYLLEITIPRGTCGAAVWPLSGDQEELEFLLDRRQRFLITAVQQNRRGGRGPVIECKVWNQGPALV